MKFSLLLISLFLYMSVSATDYYISASGNDINSGLSISTPWKTIAKVNSSNFLPGDRILFRCGDTWRETLTVPSSGSAGSPITFGAYGFGNKPIIDGSDIVSTWAADTGETWAATYSPTIGNWDTGSTQPNERMILPAANQSTSGTKVRITIKGHTAASTTILGASICERSGTSDDGVSNPVRLTFGGSNNVTIPAGQSVVSDEITYTFTKENAHLLHIYIGNAGTARTGAFLPSGRYYLISDNTDFTLTKTVSLSGPSTAWLHISKVEVMNKGTRIANVYNSNVSTEPLQIFRDGVRSTKGSSKAVLNDHEWFWAEGSLSYRDDSESPQDATYAITASVRNANIQIAKNWIGVNYITISALKLTKANFNALDWPASSTNTVITGCDINYAYMNGVSSISGAGATNVLVTLNNISWNGACGVNVIGLSHDWEISNNNVFRNCQYADGVGQHNWNAGINTWCEDGSVLKLNIVHNVIYENGKFPNNTWIDGIRGCGIHMDCPTATNYADGNFIGYNRIYDNNYMGIHLERTTYQTVAYNLIYNHADSYGITLTQWDGTIDKQASYNRIYNNTCYGNLTGITVLGVGSNTENVCVGNIVKNNICYGNTWPYQFVADFGGQNDGKMGYGNEYLYNCFGSEKNGVLKWGALSQTYALWEIAYGSSTYSVKSDPLFVDAPNGDFHLRSTSPCINAGDVVGITKDFEGNQIIGNPDIGAYEFYSLDVPVYQNSSMENATPSVIEMTYSLSLANIVPSTSAFTVLVNSAPRTVSAVAISGTKVQLNLASAIAFGDVVTVAYTKPAVSPLQTSFAGQAASISAQAVTNSINPPVPVFVSSTVGNATPSLIEMTYDLSLANIVPATTAFTVLVNSAPRTVSAVAITGTKVQLTLASAIIFGDVVTVAYTKPATSPLQTSFAGQAASISAQAVTNSINPPVPVFVSSTIGNATPSLLEMTYSLSLANIVPATSAFTVLVNSVARTVSSVTINGTKVQLTLSSAIAFGDVVNVAYTKPATSPLQTTFAGQAASITDQAVTNSINPPVPVYLSSVVGNATPSLIEMTYSLSLANIAPATPAFTVLVNSAPRTVNAVAISGTKVQLTLASAIAFGDVVTLSYTKPTVSPLQTTFAGQAASFSAQAVTNSINPPVPVYISSTVGNATPSMIEMTYSLSLANIVPATSAFTVQVNSAPGTVSAVAINGTKVQLNLASAIAFGDIVTVAYAKPATSPLQTTFAGQAVSISTQAVTNSINPPVPVFVSSTVGNATPSLVEMTYSLSLANIVPATSAFTVLVNSVQRTVSAVAINGTKVQLTLASAIIFGDVVTVSYTKPATSPLQTSSAGQAASISAQVVTNSINPPVPVYLSSTVGNATPSLIEMTYDLSLANIVPATSAFTVLVNSVQRTVSVAINGTKVQLTLASAIIFGDVVTVAYTKPATSPLQTSFAGQAASITAQSVTNSINPPVPVYLSSMVGNATPSLIEMTYDLGLANIAPATSAFTVQVNSAPRTVSSVAISGTKVQLTLASAIAFGDVATVAYAKPATSPLQTTFAGQAVSISAQAVTNSINPPVPVFVSSTVGNATPSVIEMTYSLSLANIVPATSAFTVQVNSVARTVSAVAINGTKVQLTLASAIAFGDVVTVAYTKPATSPLQTSFAGLAASITAQAVTNNINPPVPVFVSSTVGNATPSLIEMTYSLSLANIAPATSAFTVQVNSALRTVSAVAINGTKVQLTLASAIAFGDVVTVSYAKPAVSPLQTTFAGQAASITAQAVTNSINPPVPVFVSSTIGNTTPSVIEMTYDLRLANIVPATSAFTILVNSVQRTVSAVAISGTKVQLTLASAIAFGDVVTVAYTKPATSPLQTSFAGQAVSISAQAVTNSTNPTGINGSHFVPVWQGENGTNHMNLIVVSATLENLPLSADDEIAVYSGSKCVGSMILTESINAAINSTYLVIPASQDDGSNNGFINNDSIIFKIWDHTHLREMGTNVVKYKNEVSTWLTSGKYSAGATSVVEIATFTENIQNIVLLQGYNLISTYISPNDPNVGSITKRLRDQGELIKVQDEAGNSFENWGSLGGWINKLGSFESTEGYKIKVANNCTLQVTGRPVVLPLDIHLKSGWNIISFPRTDMVDAMDIIQTLIDQNKLIKVQDEAGNSIENWGTFGGWKNAIGNFTPGKAYKVKSNADAVITIHENYLKSAAIPATAAKAEYFSTNIEGNGTDHMNINIVGLQEAGLSIGDELAAFDGDVCVGSLKITKNQMIDGTVGLVASATTDTQKPNGFKEGNNIRIAAWNKLTNKEFQIQAELLNGQLNYKKEASVLVRIGALTPDAKSVNDLIKIEVYPNPCKGKFTVRFPAIPEAGSRIDILDISGRNILSRDVFETSEEFNLDQQQPGIYIVKTIIGTTQTNHKLIIY